jgi:hypothetical protein
MYPINPIPDWFFKLVAALAMIGLVALIFLTTALIQGC